MASRFCLLPFKSTPKLREGGTGRFGAGRDDYQQPSHNFQMTLNQGQFMVLNRMLHPPSKTASGGPGGDGVHSSESLLSPQLKTRLNEQMQIIRSKIAGHDTDASRLNELSYNFFPKKISKNSFIYLAQLILLKCCNKQQMKYIFWISVFQTFIQFPLTWKIMISASQTRKLKKIG